ncbi:putative Late embryogenesis abundant protein [Cocos nucifera]|uniref:Putative Late embryogenesis abundant protein n=1 Tax=Cocos nucifera TaxID=13894 RepID=A0A8K0NBE4_COCNU|nr:putative Late embryogenesis abundant protein [Cocos nucifera]
MDTKTVEEKDQVKPLSAPSPAVIPINSDEEGGATGRRSAHYLRKRRCALWCCGCCGLTIVVLGILILILSLTVFKVKDPTLTMNSITLSAIDAGLLMGSNPVSLNATLTADISIKNPNVASFKFDNSTTEFYYHEVTVGVAYAPDGKVSAHRTVRMNVTVDVLVDQVVMRTNGTLGLITGTELNLTSHTDLNGRVNVLGIYKRDIYVKMNCSMNLEISASSQQVTNTACQANVD